MKILIGVIVAVMFTAKAEAAFNLSKSDYKNFPNTLRGRDFFTKQSNITIKKSPQLLRTQSECRENIAKVLCIVNPTEEGQQPENRPCLEGSEKYVGVFENLYDNYPLVLQKTFCSLNHLFIEKDFYGTAYAGTLIDEDGNTVGAIMGIRQSVIDEQLNLATWASWKEQLSFGGVTDSYTLTPTLPTIVLQSQVQTNDFLYFVIVHEFGHILDFANNVNKTTTCSEPIDKNEDPECEMHKDSWGSISWITNQRPKFENEFLNRSSICFYWCKGNPLNVADVPQVYRDLAKTNFISIYSTTQPWDDFADSLAYYTMAKNLKLNYSIDTKQGQTYDIIEKLNSPLFSEKYKYLEDFMNRADLVYP